MNIGQRIKELRTQKGYSVNKLAYMSGVSQSYLRDVELSNKNPTVAFIEILCDSLDVSLAEFFQNETDNALSEDPLNAKLRRMTPAQRRALLDFLDTL